MAHMVESLSGRGLQSLKTGNKRWKKLFKGRGIYSEAKETQPSKGSSSRESPSFCQAGWVAMGGGKTLQAGAGGGTGTQNN